MVSDLKVRSGVDISNPSHGSVWGSCGFGIDPFGTLMGWSSRDTGLCDLSVSNRFSNLI